MLFCDFSHIDKDENLLQIDAGVLMGMVRYSQSPQNSKFATTLYNISKKVRNGVHFEHVDKHRSFYKVGIIGFHESGQKKYHNCFFVLL